MRVVIADDSVLLREGLARVLAEAGMETCELVGDAEELERAVAQHEPDVALVDIRMRRPSPMREARPRCGSSRVDQTWVSFSSLSLWRAATQRSRP